MSQTRLIEDLFTELIELKVVNSATHQSSANTQAEAKAKTAKLAGWKRQEMLVTAT